MFKLLFRLAFLLPLSLSLISCAAQYNRRMTQMMEPWIGKPVTAVIAAWGPPATVYDDAPYKVYVWHSTDTRGGGSYTTQAQSVNPVGGKVETHDVVHTVPVRTSNTYRMYWVGTNGNCAKYRFGNQP
jgi:hypothetical protein